MNTHAIWGWLACCAIGVIGSGMALAAERDPLKPRVPDSELAAAQKLPNPVASSADTIAKGKALFEGKGTCFKCHGLKGTGDGPLSKNLKPSPRSFVNGEWQKVRTDGEMFWVIKNGSPGTGMVSLIPSDINDEEAWTIIHYVRTLK
ncbi:MAG: cytochrome c [Nitrospira sp.]|nr:cytochrome c [Nitrospira sp.]